MPWQLEVPFSDVYRSEKEARRKKPTLLWTVLNLLSHYSMPSRNVVGEIYHSFFRITQASFSNSYRNVALSLEQPLIVDTRAAREQFKSTGKTNIPSML